MRSSEWRRSNSRRRRLMRRKEANEDETGEDMERFRDATRRRANRDPQAHREIVSMGHCTFKTPGSAKVRPSLGPM
jgi:hypothetical protein